MLIASLSDPKAGERNAFCGPRWPCSGQMPLRQRWLSRWAGLRLGADSLKPAARLKQWSGARNLRAARQWRHRGAPAANDRGPLVTCDEQEESAAVVL